MYMFILLHFDDQLRCDSLIVRSYELYSMYYTYKAINPLQRDTQLT